MKKCPIFHTIPSKCFSTYASKVKPTWENFTYRIFGHTNPEMERGWVYKTFHENAMPNYRLIIAPTTENIYLPEGFCEELKNYMMKIITGFAYLQKMDITIQV